MKNLKEAICQICGKNFGFYLSKTKGIFCSNRCRFISMKINGSWNKGLTKADPRILESITRMQLANIGRKFSKERKNKLKDKWTEKRRKEWSEYWKGKKMTEESKSKISKILKGRSILPKHRLKISKALKGIKRSSESVEKTKRAMRKKYQNGYTNPWIGRKHSKSSKIKMRKSQLKFIKNNPEHIKQILTFRRPNKGEIFLEKLIQSENLPYRFVGNGEFILAGKNPDFMNINGQKKLIEVAGEYWHTEEQMNKRTELFRKYGYQTLVVWYSELKNAELMKKKLRRFEYEI